MASLYSVFGSHSLLFLEQHTHRIIHAWNREEMLRGGRERQEIKRQEKREKDQATSVTAPPSREIDREKKKEQEKERNANIERHKRVSMHVLKVRESRRTPQSEGNP